jgi:hypothetical protein
MTIVSFPIVCVSLTINKKLAVERSKSLFSDNYITKDKLANNCRSFIIIK